MDLIGGVFFIIFGAVLLIFNRQYRQLLISQQEKYAGIRVRDTLPLRIFTYIIGVVFLLGGVALLIGIIRTTP
jgi:hypothetical protein